MSKRENYRRADSFVRQHCRGMLLLGCWLDGDCVMQPRPESPPLVVAKWARERVFMGDQYRSAWHVAMLAAKRERMREVRGGS